MDSSCNRCGAPAALVSRGEHFCSACFVRFVSGKARRRLEGLKVAYARDGPAPAPRPVVLALGLTAASITLLDLLTESLAEQRRVHRGRVGFDLTAVHVDVAADAAGSTAARAAFDRLAAANADVRFVWRDPADFLASPAEFAAAADGSAGFGADAPPATLAAILAAVDRSARPDLVAIVVERLVAATAAGATVIWADTMTRLAERTLALTAKGRGAAIPAALAEGAALQPLREVLRSEAEAYVRLRALDGVCERPARPAVVRMMSVDDVMRGYIADVEPAFPSVVSTVVRTADKLQDSGPGAAVCVLCGAASDGAPQRWLERITVQAAPAPADPPADPAPLCYGCVVATRGRAFPWPRPSGAAVAAQFEISE
ncbi:uncharacterized protein V1510DRAFT_388702 [Dipodascopsis tothii]|uniref:uncharacterized protein n=1 Tax=Dipodascopsis tothii TaxID=44089 RepID=UPI0034CF19A7